MSTLIRMTTVVSKRRRGKVYHRLSRKVCKATSYMDNGPSGLTEFKVVHPEGFKAAEDER